MPLQIVAQCFVQADLGGQDKYTWSQAPGGTQIVQNVWRVGEGHFVIQFQGELTPGISAVYVTTDGISPGIAKAHSDVVPVVRQAAGPVGHRGLEIELIRYNKNANTITGYENKNSNFWFLVVEGDHPGVPQPVQEGWPA